jgi:hypothetical protein
MLVISLHPVPSCPDCCCDACETDVPFWVAIDCLEGAAIELCRPHAVMLYEKLGVLFRDGEIVNTRKEHP